MTRQMTAARPVMTLLGCAAAAVGLATVAACDAGGSSSVTVAQAAEPMSCEALASLVLPETTITLAEAVPNGVNTTT